MNLSKPIAFRIINEMPKGKALPLIHRVVSVFSQYLIGGISTATTPRGERAQTGLPMGAKFQRPFCQSNNNTGKASINNVDKEINVISISLSCYFNEQ
jgi:hypothetical protein